jgi:hypothetical protein
VVLQGMCQSWTTLYMARYVVSVPDRSLSLKEDHHVYPSDARRGNPIRLCAASPSLYQTSVHTLEYAHLPELLARILAAYPLQDLCATWMLFHEWCHLVHVVVDDYVEALLDTRVLLDIFRCELLRHVGVIDSIGPIGSMDCLDVLAELLDLLGE